MNPRLLHDADRLTEPYRLMLAADTMRDAAKLGGLLRRFEAAGLRCDYISTGDDDVRLEVPLPSPRTTAT